MSLILINKGDITVGKPLPWPLYDQGHKVLVAQGGLIRDNEHLDKLLTHGIYRELSWEAPGDNLPAAKATPDQTKANETGTQFTFDDMRLKVGDRLQLEPPAQLGLKRERILVKVIGYLRDTSLLVTAPTTANGARLQLMEGEKVVMRSFSGQNAFAFACAVERVCKLPYEYLHLSFPNAIQGVVIRRTPRVKASIVVAVQNTNSQNEGEQVSALISDISADGAALDAKHPLGDKGDILNLAFRVNLHKIDALLSIKGLIRTILSGEAADTSGTKVIRYGIEFKSLQPNDMVILQSMLYQQMVESPHHLM